MKLLKLDPDQTLEGSSDCDSGSLSEGFYEHTMKEVNARNGRDNGELRRRVGSGHKPSKWDMAAPLPLAIQASGPAIVADEEQQSPSLYGQDLRPPFLKPTRQVEHTFFLKEPAFELANQSSRGSWLARSFHDKKRVGNWSPDATEQDESLVEQVYAAGGYTRSKSQSQQREHLPISYVGEEILQVVRENQVAVIYGINGCGKTIKLPQLLVKYAEGVTGMVACSIPERVAAVEVAKRVCENSTGYLVGYETLSENWFRPGMKIKYLTERLLICELLKDTELEQYSVIMVDEAHEGRSSTDLLLALMKGALSSRRDLKLIITSDTLPYAVKASKFFGGAPLVQIPGSSCRAQTIYRETKVKNHVEAAVMQALRIHSNCPPGHIIIFMPDLVDANATFHTITERSQELEANAKTPMPKLVCCATESEIAEEDSEGTRMCIITSDVGGELFKTIRGISFVIDSGLIKVRVYNPCLFANSKQVIPISRCEADWRAELTTNGVCYRLFTKETFEKEMDMVPEIRRTKFDRLALVLKFLKVEDVFSYEFLHKPPRENIEDGLLLWFLGAVSDVGRISQLGKEMVRFPFNPHLA